MISIIMPAYNSEQWIEAAIQSVVVQSYADWELLVIDDCSNDSTAERVKRIAATDKRIHLISNSINGGTSRSRNIGLREARGEYISFIDSDDLMTPYLLEYLLHLMNAHNAQLACGKIISFSKRVKIKDSKWKNEHIEIFTGEAAVEKGLYQLGVEASMYGKLYRKELFEDLKFREGELYEDLSIFYLLALRCERIVESSINVYLYRRRPGSLIHTFNSKRLIVLDITKHICDYMEENYPQLLPAAIDRRFSANFNMLQLMLTHRKDSEGKVKPSTLDKDKILEKETESTYDARIRECYAYILQNASMEIKNKKIRKKNRIGALAAKFLPRRILFGMLKIL